MSTLGVAASAALYAGGAIAGPAFVNEKVILFSPLTHKVHLQALTTLNGDEADFTYGLKLYLAKPVDRLIQACAAIAFCQIEYFTDTADLFKSDQIFWATCHVVLAPGAIVVNLAIGILQASVLVANAVVQVVIPFQAVYGGVKGREAALEYFDYRATVIATREKGRSLFTSDTIGKWLPSQPENVEKPKNSLEDIAEEHPLHRGVAEAANVAQVVDRAANTSFTLLAILEPAVALTLARQILVA